MAINRTTVFNSVVAAGMIAGASVALRVWADTTQLKSDVAKLASIERVDGIAQRVKRLEDGETTPMAAETKARFEALESSMQDVKRGLDKVSQGQEKIMERLLDQAERRR